MVPGNKLLGMIAGCLLSLALVAGALAQEPQEGSPDVPSTDTPTAPLLGAAPNWKITEVYNSGSVGEYASLVIEPNTLQYWIAYHSQFAGLVQATGPKVGYTTCTAPLWKCTAIDNFAIGHFDYSFPTPGDWAIVYQSASATNIYTSECTTIPNCVATKSAIDNQPNGVIGEGNSVTHDLAGGIHVSYTRSSPAPAQLRYATWVGTGGNCFGGNYPALNCEIVDPTIGAGGNTSIDTTFIGLPRIAYRGVNGELMLASRVSAGTGNCGPSNSWRCEVIDSSGDVGNYIDLYVPKCFINCSDFMQIAYMNKTSGLMRYAKNIGSGGNCGPSNSWVCNPITSTGYDAGGMGISLKVYNNEPLIAYMDHDDQSNDVLKIAFPVSSGGNCAFGSWMCTTVDDGYRGFANNVPIYHDVGRYASLARFTGGAPAIAYQDITDLSLVLIEQSYAYYLPLVRR